MTEAQREKKLAYNRAYYVANRTRLLVYNKARADSPSQRYENRKPYMKAWYKANAQKRSEQMRAWYQETKADPVKFRVYRRKMYATRKLRPDLRLQREKKWRVKNPERVKVWSRINRAHRLGADGTYTSDQWLARFRFYGECCAYCLSTLTLESATVDHVIPIVAGGKNWPSNLVPACSSCNGYKGRKRLLPLWLRKES